MAQWTEGHRGRLTVRGLHGGGEAANTAAIEEDAHMDFIKVGIHYVKKNALRNAVSVTALPVGSNAKTSIQFEKAGGIVVDSTVDETMAIIQKVCDEGNGATAPAQVPETPRETGFMSLNKDSDINLVAFSQIKKAILNGTRIQPVEPRERLSWATVMEHIIAKVHTANGRRFSETQHAVGMTGMYLVAAQGTTQGWAIGAFTAANAFRFMKEAFRTSSGPGEPLKKLQMDLTWPGDAEGCPHAGWNGYLDLMGSGS